MKSFVRPALIGLGFTLLAGGLAQAQTLVMPDAVKGGQTFTERCAACHVNPADRAPPKDALAAMGPDAINRALTTGVMQPMASGLSANDIESVALYLTGKAPASGKVALPPIVNACPKADKISMTPAWNGWSPDLINTRFQPNGGIKAADVPKLKVKWTYSLPGSKVSETTVVGERMFVGTSTGLVFSINAKTGCTYWRYEAAGSVRATPLVGKLAKAPSGYAVYISDSSMKIHALDAVSGAELWSTAKLEDHPRSLMTGAATLYNGVIYAPISSGEEVAISTTGYICCTFRGSLSAIDAATGKVLWKTFTIPEAPHAYRPGKPQMGPAGAAVWSAPTVDAKRGLVYVATGDSYTDVDTQTDDAIMAIEMKTGKIAWANQVTENDNFVVGCPRTGTNPNCPTPVGPDHDFGSSPILMKLANGKDILLAGQKSSEAYGLDPDNKGKVLWRVKLGRGGASGGVEWGMAAEKDQLFVALADAGANGKPQLTALNIADGKINWTVPTPKVDCPAPRRCALAQSAPVSAIPGVVVSGAMDGHLRAYDAKTGAIVWDFDTVGQAYDTVNGVKGAKGGTIDATGAVVAGGMMFQESGYGGVMATATQGANLLMAFSVDGK